MDQVDLNKWLNAYVGVSLSKDKILACIELQNENACDYVRLIAKRIIWRMFEIFARTEFKRELMGMKKEEEETTQIEIFGKNGKHKWSTPTL